MKQIFYILFAIIFIQNISFANYNDIYVADIKYDWINKNDVEKEAIIKEVHDIIFEKSLEKKKNLKSEFKEK